MAKKNLEETITIRASKEYKNKLQKLAKDATGEVGGIVKITDLVRLGLDWISVHTMDELVDFLVGEQDVANHK